MKNEIKYKDEQNLRIGDNEDTDQRRKGRAVGKVKRALCELQQNRTDVITDRRAGEVWIGEERVAKWVVDRLRLRGEALKCKARIDALIEEKRKPRDDLSEESE